MIEPPCGDATPDQMMVCRIAGAERFVDDHAAALTHQQARRARQLVARPDAGGGPAFIMLLAGSLPSLKSKPLHAPSPSTALVARAQVRLHAERMDAAEQQHVAAVVVQLTRQQARRDLDHVCGQSELLHRACGFEAEPRAAEHGRRLRLLRVGFSIVIQVVDGAVRKRARACRCPPSEA